MCNRCDGGNKPLIQLTCEKCDFVFYHVDNPHLDEKFICPKCGGEGMVTDDLE